MQDCSFINLAIAPAQSVLGHPNKMHYIMHLQEQQ
uniref:Uncharacterized protein n=1 Tax=Anguilla anguilla TaxID=7936 RepID=A0A0E9UX51_ANGAN